MSPIIISGEVFLAVLAKQRDERLQAAKHLEGRFPSIDKAKFLRQCPQCMTTAEPSHPSCESCGLRFFTSTESESRDLRNIYVGLGSAAFLLACVLGAVIRYI